MVGFHKFYVVIDRYYAIYWWNSQLRRTWSVYQVNLPYKNHWTFSISSVRILPLLWKFFSYADTKINFQI